jgi:septal ring factor EnvC (AmiA/AmiB activator)
MIQPETILISSHEPTPHPSKSAWTIRLRGFIYLFAVLLGLCMAVLFSQLIRQTFNAQGPKDTTNLQNQIVALDLKVTGIEKRLNDLSASVTQNTGTPGKGDTKSIVDDLTQLKNQLTTLSSTVNTLQTEKEQASNRTTRAQQNFLTTVVAYIDLRAAAVSGGSFATELATMRAVSKNMPVFRGPSANWTVMPPRGSHV